MKLKNVKLIKNVYTCYKAVWDRLKFKILGKMLIVKW
jgi:hypothetical protein